MLNAAGFTVNRSEAVNIYKEILNLSEAARYSTFNLKLSDKNDPIAQDYQIHVSMYVDPLTNQQLTSIAKKYNLAVKEERGEVVVYEPKKISRIL